MNFSRITTILIKISKISITSIAINLQATIDLLSLNSDYLLQF